MPHSKDNQPTVSVVMATYNGEKYIREQLDSILAQTYPIRELIIQDDCSTDSTPAICREYESKYPNVHFFENESNLGFNKNFQTAAMRATSDFVALSDQDDVWFPQKIEKQVASIGDHDICTCSICRGTTLKDAIEELNSNDIRPATHIFRTLLGHTILCPNRFITDSKNWEGGLNYDWGLTLHADWGNGIIKVKDVLVFHRSHDNSFTSEQAKLMRKPSIVAPYLKGFHCFRNIQQSHTFQEFYKYVSEHTLNTDNEAILLQHRLSLLMLSKTFFNYIRLSILCMLKRKEIYYPAHKANGIQGIIRGLFFPGIFAYYAPTIFTNK